jgi:hypothetical protein
MRKSNAVLYTQNPTSNVITLASLSLVKQPNTVHLRDGELVLYKRGKSTVWQARFKLYDKRWHSISTKHHNLEFASRAACEIYDESQLVTDYRLTIFQSSALPTELPGHLRLLIIRKLNLGAAESYRICLFSL